VEWRTFRSPRGTLQDRRRSPRAGLAGCLLAPAAAAATRSGLGRGHTWPKRSPFAARWDGAFPMKVEGGRIAPMTPEDVRETARYVASHRAGSSPFELVVAGERRAKPEGWRPHRGGLRGGRRHLVDGEHRLLAFRVDGGRVLAVRTDAPSSAARTAGGMRHGQASAGTVVATDSVSAGADRDNGAAVSPQSGHRGDDERAAKRAKRQNERTRATR
jgi:hypothetical protein